MAKAAQFRTFAEYVNEYKPDIVSFDANEPLKDHYDIERMEFFDQGQGEQGKSARLFFEELKNNNLCDVYAKVYRKEMYEEGKPLITSHIIGSTKAERRYDFVFAKEDIKVRGVQYRYDEAVNASSDHAMIIADLDECKEPKRDYYSFEYSNTKVTCTNCWEGTYEPVGDPMAKIHHWFKCNKCGEHIEFLPSVTVE